LKEKLKKEGKILKLSVLLSTLFTMSEIIMAFISNSKALLMDSIFAIADVIIILIISFLLPLIYKPVTEKRPYGYSQIESIFIIIKGISVAIIAAFLIKDNIEVLATGGSELDCALLMFYQIIEVILFIGVYSYLKKKAKKVDTPVIESDLVGWKIDTAQGVGMFVSFFLQFILKYTNLSFIVPYIDSTVAILISILMIKEPIEMVIDAFKSLVLFAPEKETMEEIKEIVSRKIKKYPYEVTFYDIVRTGRKIWIELYIKSDDMNINLKELKKAKKDVESSLKKEFDEIYVEFTPEI